MAQPEAVVSTFDIKDFIRTVPDYPEAGVQFRDISPLLADAEAMAATIDMLVEPHVQAKPDVIAGLDARGFIFGAAMQRELSLPFVPLRKAGKLPYATHQAAYSLEYGEPQVLEMHIDAIEPGNEVVIVDDLLATGGTVEAAVNLVRKAGGTVVEACFVIELPELKGRQRLEALGVAVRSLVEYEGL